MTEQRVNALQSLHGLQDYFGFVGETDNRQYIDFLLKLLYAEQPVIRENEPFSLEEFVYTLRQYATSDMLESFYKYYRLEYPAVALQDAFSRGQIQSKIWLIEELSRQGTHWDKVAVFAGWFGQINAIYDQKLTCAKMRIVELDRQACEASDYVFNLRNLENHRVKAVHADINNLTLHRNGYEWPVENFRENTRYQEKFLPDLIINTSAEHMSEQWFFELKYKGMKSPPIVAIQSNNLFDIPEHVNCVHSQDHMLKKFPMNEVVYAGELQLKGYKRFMIIGRP
jgi:hypothetical protein